MFLPPQYFWLEPVIIAAVVVFVIDLVGNTISFSNRFLNALVTSVVFAVVFGSLVYFGYGNISMSVSSTPSASAPAKAVTTHWVRSSYSNKRSIISVRSRGEHDCAEEVPLAFWTGRRIICQHCKREKASLWGETPFQVG